ncbi:catalase [Hymenobacter aquaticus]|uniref:Catalase n=1 Tax=Hymenobacter aquaticus TaxID=1867101 RepID=A0A4Z0Q0U6_9BACT|nr:catalase family protein [Hymenobacter aquaticus]TGE23658.1 catalase [Hymenobacter aquaticus]
MRADFASLPYVPFSPAIEQPQPNEQQLMEETVAAMRRMAQSQFDQHRHANRDAHAKSHAIVRGELHIPADLPPHLAQGLFALPGTYPVIIRLSTAAGQLLPDKVSGFRGFALKVLNVPGPKLGPEDLDALTQDWLLVNHPAIATGTVQQYHDAVLKAEKTAGLPEEVRTVASVVGQAVHKGLAAVGVQKDLLPLGLDQPQNHILGETFHSMGTFRYGDYLAKISVAPLSENVRALTGQVQSIEADSAWRDILGAFFREQGAEYELRAQLCTNLDTMPVEDGSVEWPAADSPFQPIGRLVITAQESYSPARRVFGDDVLSFSPFHCLPAHQPLGSINRVRRLAYPSSSRFRHEQNAQPRREPRDISELPD